MNARPWRCPEGLQAGLVRDEDAAGAIADLARAPGSKHTALEEAFEVPNSLQGPVKSNAFVHIVTANRDTSGVAGLDRNNLVSKFLGASCVNGALLGQIGVLVESIFREVVFFGENFRARKLAEHHVR